MVESGDKKTQNPPSADDLARAEHYAAMMAAIARDDEDDFDLDEEDLDVLDRQKLLEAVAQQATGYQDLASQDLDQDDKE